MVGSLAATGAKLYLGSDIRTKENITPVGRTKAGHIVYEYEYKPEFKNRKYFGHGRFRGVMAHEVEHIPGAVFTTEDGYKVVNYSKVN
jgi:TctA family transporter